MNFDDTIDPQTAEYKRRLETLTDQALRGQIDKREFIEAAEAVVLAMFMVAFLIGGGNPAVMDATIQADRDAALRSVRLLADDIYSGRYSQQMDGEEITQTAAEGRVKLGKRLLLWGIALVGIYHLGKLNTLGGDNKRYMWLYRSEKLHCSTCRRLHMMVLTAAEWKRLGLRPQSIDLECKGFYCGCRLVETNKPSVGLVIAKRVTG